MPDLKFAAICLYEQGILRLNKILECIGFSRETFYQLMKLYNSTTGNEQVQQMIIILQYMRNIMSFLMWCY